MTNPTTDRDGVEQTWDALTKAGYSIDVFDGAGEEFKGLSRDKAVEEVMSCDDGHFIAFLNGKRVGFIWFVFGNEPDEVICDYAVTLEHIMDPLTEGWWD